MSIFSKNSFRLPLLCTTIPHMSGLIVMPCSRGSRSLASTKTDTSNTPDAFIHDYQKLRIGGKLRNSDEDEIDFIRRKGRKNTLLSPTGEPLGDDALRAFLHGVNREIFQSIFGINHDELVEGSKDILKGEGEVGQSLFAAGLGSGNLRDLLVERGLWQA